MYENPDVPRPPATDAHDYSAHSSSIKSYNLLRRSEALLSAIPKNIMEKENQQSDLSKFITKTKQKIEKVFGGTELCGTTTFILTFHSSDDS